MKDVVRDELRYRLFVACINAEGDLPSEITGLLKEALAYVENNPSILQVENEIRDLSDELDDHATTLSVMEAYV